MRGCGGGRCGGLLRTALVLLGLTAGGATGALAADAAAVDAGPAVAPAAVRVALRRDGTQWTADFEFPDQARVRAFVQSALVRATGLSWRSAQWKVLTPGVTLDRIGHYDVLQAPAGLPRQVRLALQPAAVKLIAANSPALLLSNGAVAMYSRQFDTMSLDSLQAVRDLPADLNGSGVAVQPAQVRYTDTGGPVLHAGVRQAALTLSDVDAYVLFGPVRELDTPALATLIDPGLPAWIADDLARYTPELIAHYAARLGPRSAGRPTVLAAWSGPTPQTVSLQGSVIPGLVALHLEGARLQQPLPQMTERVRWLIAHEAAHFWLGQEVRVQRASEAWISEGGADLMAVRGLEQRLPGFDAAGVLQHSVDECVRLAQGKPLAGAALRNEHRAYYACGLVFGRVAEAALRRSQPGADFFDFLRPLIAAHRAQRVLPAADWLAELTRISGDPTLAADITRMLDVGVDDPAGFIASLYARAGV